MKFCRIPAVAAAFVLVCAVQGCGGGGGGGGGESGGGDSGGVSANAKAQGESYLAHIEDAISSALLQFDIDGVLQLDGGSLVAFKPSTLPSGCALTSTPASADLAVCNPLVEGKAFIICDNAASSSFQLALFNSKDIQPASLVELAGMTLQGVSCGDSSVRSTTETVSFSPDATMATHFIGGSSFTWTGNYLATMASPAGVQYFSVQRRWVTYKLATPSGTEYVLLELNERFDQRDPINQSRIFRVQKPL